MKMQPPVVLITGAGKGSGRRLAEAFASQGAWLALNDIAPNNLDAMLEEWKDRSYTVVAYVEDVAKQLSAQALIHQVMEHWGRIDVLINHANVEPRSPLLEMDEWDWHRTLEVNLTGAFLMTQLVGRLMRTQGSGVILNLISLAGESTMLNRSAYAAAQMGLIGLTWQAARELHPYGIRVHALGQGLARFDNAPGNVPRQLDRAALFLAGPHAADLSGILLDTA